MFTWRPWSSNYEAKFWLKSSQKHVFLCGVHCARYCKWTKENITLFQEHTEQPWGHMQAHWLHKSLWPRPSATPFSALTISMKYLMLRANIHLRFWSRDLRFPLHLDLANLLSVFNFLSLTLTIIHWIIPMTFRENTDFMGCEKCFRPVFLKTKQIKTKTKNTIYKYKISTKVFL